MGDETNDVDVNVGQISTPEEPDNFGETADVEETADIEEPGTPDTDIAEGDDGVDLNQGTIGIPTRSDAVNARRSRKSSRNEKRSRKQKKSRKEKKSRKQKKTRKHRKSRKH